LAKFEVCGHKFVDYSEYGYGVTLLNDCKYGFSVHGNVMRMSILRSPKSPDAHCDIGEHVLRYAIVPHKGTFAESQAVKHGYEFNIPLITRYSFCHDSIISSLTDILSSPTQIAASQPDERRFFSIDKPNVVIDTVKKAEEGKDLDIIVRLYEAYGGRGQALLMR
jgi:alpha-mannosidase